MKKALFALLCTLCCCTSAFSQSKPTISLDDIVSRLQTLSTTKATEKVYLHVDRALYNAGDTVFFKAYLTLGEQHQLSKLSGVVHVDLMNAADSVVQTESLLTNNGLTWGDFALPNSLPKGAYHIRAYTRWMLNNADPNIFDQAITVSSSVAPVKALIGKQTKITNKFDIQFFAEGGTLVNDIPAKIAFKAIDHTGKGTDVKGVVVDNLNTEVTKFEAKHLGMGLIYLTPVEGRTYKAKLTYADGTKATVDLPKADDKGMTLLVNNDKPDKLMIEINANRAYYLANKNKEIGITIYSGGGAVRSVKTSLDGQVLDLNLDKKDFQTGIVRITLFSQNGEPMNERLSFVQNNDLINLQTSGDKAAYATRSKVHIILNAKSKNDKPIVGYFSASVTDATKIPVNESTETSILSHLLLTSELQGFVEQPGYYFTNINNDKQADLDVLMLTQGYRRFDWKQLLNDKTAATADVYPVERGIDLSGVIKTNKGETVTNGSVTLLTKNGGTMLNQVTDADGRFNFANLIYTDNTPFILQAKTEEGKSNVQIIMDQPKKVSLLADNAKFADDDAKTDKSSPNPLYMADASGKLLKEVIVKDKNIDPELNTVDQFKDQSGVSRGIEGHLPGVALSNGVPYLRERMGLAGAGPMLVIIDGAQASSNIDNLSVSDVESVKMLKNNDAAIYGLQGSNGVLLITTVKNKSVPVNRKMSPGIISYLPHGFYKSRVFYSPAYGGSTPTGSKPDDRKTIYWNPDIVTDKDGSASFDFYNADGKGKYRVVIEGIDDNGAPGYSVFTYDVQ